MCLFTVLIHFAYPPPDILICITHLQRSMGFFHRSCVALLCQLDDVPGHRAHHSAQLDGVGGEWGGGVCAAAGARVVCVA